MASSVASEFSLSSIGQNRIKQVVFEGLPKDRWFTLVLDPISTGVLSSHLRMHELLDFNVTVVEDLTKKRKEGQAAVYLIAPVSASINRVIEDFQQNPPLYEQVYLFLTSKLPEKLLTMLKSCTPLLNRLRALKEVHTEYWNLDSHAFHTGQPTAMVSLFGEDIKQASWDAEALKAGHRLATLFTSLKSQPAQIYVRTPTDLPEVPLNAFRMKACQVVGERVRDNLNGWKMKDPGLFTGPPCDLIILDRGFDPVAPVMHPFHYGAAIHDLIPLEDGMIYNYTEKGGRAGGDTVIDVLLNEQDELFCEWRHCHVGQVLKLIPEKTQQIAKGKTAQLAMGDGRRDMGKVVQGLPEYLAMKRKIEINTALIREIMNQLNKRDLNEVGKLEQGVVFGELKSRDLITAMQNWNGARTEGQPTNEDKMRLLLSYFVTNPGKLDNSSRSQWQDIARIKSAQMHTVCNIRYLGVELLKAKTNALGFGKKASKAKYKSSGVESAIENDRFRPLLTEVVDSLMSRKLASMPNISVVKAGNEFDAALAGDVDVPGVASVRANRAAPTWHNKLNKGAASQGGVGAGERIVVIYMLGGYTWTEVQAAHELSQQHKIQIILGGTHIIHSGEAFLQDLANLSPLGTGNVEVDMDDD